MRVKKITITIVVLFSFLHLISCSTSTPQSLIIGKWQLKGGLGTWEFFKDGTLKVVGYKNEVFEGKYMFVEADQIKFEYGIYTKETTKIAVSRNELTFITLERTFQRIE